MSDWNSWQTLLAVIATGTFDGAARQLGVNSTTVSRRIRQLEALHGSALLLREGGQLVPAESVRMLLPHLNKAADELAVLAPERRREVLPNWRIIRITATPSFCDCLLAPELHTLQGSASLRIELYGDNRNLNMSRREADFALRFAPLVGANIQSRHLVDVSYSVIARHGVDAESLPWVSGGRYAAHVPSNRWVEEKAAQTTGVRYTATSLSAMVATVRTGQARALVPRYLVADEADIVEVETDVFHRELWFISTKGPPPTDDHTAVEQWIIQQATKLV